MQTTARSLAHVLALKLQIPTLWRRNLYVERALQERRAAATALEYIDAHLLCLEAELENLAGADAESRRTLAQINALVADIRGNLRYDEGEMMLAEAEI